MKLFKKAADGGATSGVTGFFLVESKRVGSVVLLRFQPGTREAYHSHAFNAVTLWLRGEVREHRFGQRRWNRDSRTYRPGQFKITRRHDCHQVEGIAPVSWAISFRGPWRDYWYEMREGRKILLTHGRKEVTLW